MGRGGGEGKKGQAIKGRKKEGGGRISPLKGREEDKSRRERERMEGGGKERMVEVMIYVFCQPLK